MEVRKDPTLDLPSDFNFWTPAVFHKGGDGKIREVGGVISTDDLDIQQERMLQEGLDLDYFMEKGVIKFEHTPKGQTPSAKNIIGFPKDVKRGEHETSFTGEIFPEADGNGEADAAWKLLKSTEAFNKRNPKFKKSIGWSIEGRYKRRETDGVVTGAVVTNVVLTANPINKNTIATIAKSLEAGYGTSPSTQTGGGALRKESLQTTLKNQSFKGGKKMEKCKCGTTGFEKCMSYHKSQGMEDDAATTAATSHYPDLGKSVEIPSDINLPEPSSFTKALEAHNELIAEDQAFWKGVEDNITGFKPSKPEPTDPPKPEGDFIDVTKDVSNISKSLNALSERTENSDATLAKSLEHLGQIAASTARIASESAQAALEDRGRVDDLTKSVDAIRQQSEETLNLVKAVAGKEITHDVMGILSPIEGGSVDLTAGNGEVTADKLLHNLPFLMQTLEKGISENVVNPNSVTELEVSHDYKHINPGAVAYLESAARTQANG